MAIDFIHSKDSDEIRTFHTKSHIIEIIMGNQTDNITSELFESILQKHQEVLEESMKEINIFF